ncbi:hypothetical protein J8F10_08725 [Gemmata sp. G18]|uniref:ATP-binding protein n=1 Tax=Gemmata palustris TaxID=2822762 RepID=A0ABS5BPH5_9BACT|nr:hypothetical protein [Gemmata palustris]MBP3955362.1 hypothetical protein [Gemmata palustris]
MSHLSEWVFVSQDEKPYVNFEESLEVDQVASGYVPVRSTLEVFDFLREAVGPHSPRGRAVICHGTYGTGKSRLCTVLARLFQDGFDCPALLPVWGRLRARQQGTSLDSLKQAMVPSGKAWRPWLVVPLYADGGGGRLSTAFVRGLLKALRRAGLSEEVLGKTVFHEAATRLDNLVSKGKVYQPAPNSRLATAEQMARALRQDFDEHALQEFCDWHMRETVVDFYDYLRASGGAYEAHEIYPLVAERVQRHGYEGILVIWDEFGLALESLLKGAQNGKRDMHLEAIGLQDFVERACGSNDLGKRVVFMAFTHMSLTEYGQRSNLSETDRNRLETVAARFRQPSIFIKLSVTEMEGYHLLAGMLHRTKAGEAVFQNPVPRLQQIATRMPRQRFWQNISAEAAYQDVVAPCYPLHPATSSSLLLLSDRIAQVNRTAFYYLQSREEGGVAGALETRVLPPVDEAGGGELLRISDLLPFFSEPLRQKEPHLVGQYEQAVARLPGATPMEAAILRAVLVLAGIKSADMAPTTVFLSFCLCDAEREEIGATALHEALSRLKEAHALWKNEATDVWNFVTDRGLGQDLEKEIDGEKALVPADKTTGELLRTYESLRVEVTDRLGEMELDPNDAGIVRRVAVRLLDPAKGEKAIDAQNPALAGGDSPAWLSAVIYLAAADTAAQLDACRKLAETPIKGEAYMILPSAPMSLSSEKARELIAVKQLLEKKDSQSHAFEVLENKLTKLREELRTEFARTFGNEGLRSGTGVLKVGQTPRTVPVSSWGQLLPSIARDLDTTYHHQPRVRCGSYNEWLSYSGGAWKKIEYIVEAILKFDEQPEYQTDYLNFNDTSQEGAVIDGVLCENGFFSHNSASGKWELAVPTSETPSEPMRETLKYLASRSTSDKPFIKLFERLVEPPYGMPNGIMPLFVALVFRSEPSRIGIYRKKYNNWERVETKIAEAIVDMARFPDRYQTRYSKLSPKQRWVFRVIGAELEVKVPEGGAADRIEEACEKVSAQLRDIVHKLPEAALTLRDLSEPEKDILKVLRGGVPPQPTLLADHLMRWIQEDAEARQELEDAGSTRPTFPATVRLWRDLRERLGRQVEGARAPVRRQLQNVGNDRDGVVESLRKVEAFAGPENRVISSIMERLAASDGKGELIEEVVAAVANKEARQLSQEDYGRASGILEVIQSLAPSKGKMTVIMPDGGRREFPEFTHDEALVQVRQALRGWRDTFALDPDQLAALLLTVVFAKCEPEAHSTAVRHEASVAPE